MGDPPKLMKNPLMDRRESQQESQPVSQKALSENDGEEEKNSPWMVKKKRIVLDRKIPSGNEQPAKPHYSDECSVVA